jgi:ABC-2 type transport system ATP-binding protein
MNVIEVTDLVKRYGDRTAVDGVSFSVEEGEIFAILGPNGAGKTTTVESISGLRTPDSGSIRVLGLDPQRLVLRGAAGRRTAARGPRAGGQAQVPVRQAVGR